MIEDLEKWKKEFGSKEVMNVIGDMVASPTKEAVFEDLRKSHAKLNSKEKGEEKSGPDEDEGQKITRRRTAFSRSGPPRNKTKKRKSVSAGDLTKEMTGHDVSKFGRRGEIRK